MTYFLIFFGLLLNIQAFACEFEVPSQISIATSLKKQKSFDFNAKQSFHDKTIIRAVNCQKLALTNQYMMLALGPEIIEYDDSIKSFSFTDNLRESATCRIENAPKTSMSFEEKKKIFLEKKKYIKECVEVFVEDEGNMPLNMKTEQKGCTVEKLVNNRAKFKGGFCFVKPNFASTFLVKVRIRKECQSAEELAKLGVQASDLKANLNFYAAGDDSGHSTQLTALQTLPLRILTNAEEKFMPASDDFGLDYPSFPTNWVDVNATLAQPDLVNRGDHVLFKTKFWVDNRCERKCADGICMGECDFATPVTANIALKAFSEKKKKYEYLTSWIDGGVAQPGFQGILNGVGFDIPSHYINENDRYRLEVEFDDPKFDFERFKNNIKRKYGRIEQHLPRLGRSDITDIPDINEIREQAILPSIRLIHGLNFDQELNGIASAIDNLRQYLNYRIWPPYFAQLCDKTRSSCKDISKKYMTMILDFKIKQNGSEYSLDIIQFKKKDIFNNKLETKQLPTFKCGF